VSEPAGPGRVPGTVPAIIPTLIRRIFEGRVFTVLIERITLPKGHEIDMELVRHPGSVVLIPVADDGRLILVRQYRHAIGKWVWELPAGTLKKDEAPEAAAARECQEEIGLIPGRLERLPGLYPSPGYCDEEMIFFRATALRTPGDGDPTATPDEDEDIECKAFTIDEIHALIASGEVIDLKTVAGLALMAERGRRL